MKPETNDAINNTSSDASPTTPLVFSWRDPNASMQKRIIAITASIVLLPVFLFFGLMSVFAWVYLSFRR
jgi:hypothetical protein